MNTQPGKLRLLLVRHGETDWNLEQRIQGQLQIPLNAKGRRQAELAAERLTQYEFRAAWSSDLVRARETAEVILARLPGLGLGLDEALREANFGLWEGLTYGEFRAAAPEAAAQWIEAPEEVEAPGGESLVQMRARVVAFARELLDRHPGSTVLLITHGGPIRALVAEVSGVRMTELPDPANGSLTSLILTDSDGQLVTYNDIEHLAKAN